MGIIWLMKNRLFLVLDKPLCILFNFIMDLAIMFFIQLEFSDISEIDKKLVII